jgi:hypothetical protein
MHARIAAHGLLFLGSTTHMLILQSACQRKINLSLSLFLSRTLPIAAPAPAALPGLLKKINPLPYMTEAPLSLVSACRRPSLSSHQLVLATPAKG